MRHEPVFYALFCAVFAGIAAAAGCYPPSPLSAAIVAASTVMTCVCLATFIVKLSNYD